MEARHYRDGRFGHPCALRGPGLSLLVPSDAFARGWGGGWLSAALVPASGSHSQTGSANNMPACPPQPVLQSPGGRLPGLSQTRQGVVSCS